MKRLKNYGLWVSVIALLPLIVEALTDYSIFVHLPGNYQILAESVLGIFVLLGLINNPTTDNKGFLDDK